MHQWLGTQLARGAQLELTGASPQEPGTWLGPRLVWYPRGNPAGRRIGLVSSRLGRRLDNQHAWFTVFRAVCGKLDRRRDVLLTASATTAERFVARAAELFEVRVLSLQLHRPSETIAQWLKRMRRDKDDPSGLHRAHLSPVLWDGAPPPEHEASLVRHPLQDRALVALSERLLVFHLRRGGHLEQLVRARLAHATWPTTSVYVALGTGLVERELADELLDLGAVGWLVLDTLASRVPSARGSRSTAVARLVPLPAADDWQFLTHCTREQAAGWPDQDERQYERELILEPAACDRSALGALRRILIQQRLIATTRVVRGRTPVVSFTAVPLLELPALRVFRPHLGRWDFEPYGICLRREWLAARGAQAVCYGDEARWQSLAERERPFFQLHRSRPRKSRAEIDWSVEREWRHVGDVDLSELPPEAGLVFVPSRREADQLAPLSRWPLTILRRASKK